MAQSSIGGTYLAEKRFAEARSEFSKVVSDPQAEASLSDLVRFTIAGSYGDEGQLDKGCAELTKLLADPKLGTSVRFLAQKELGGNLFTQGHFAEARAELIKATQIEGIDALEIAGVQSRIGITYQAEGHDKEAESFIANSQAAWFSQANASLQQNLAESRLRYQAALSLVDKNTSASFIAILRVKIADTYIGERNSEFARQELQAAQEVLAKAEGKSQDAKVVAQLEIAKQMAQYSTSLSYVADENQERAIEELKKLLQMPNLNAGLRATAERDLSRLKAAKTAGQTAK